MGEKQEEKYKKNNWETLKQEESIYQHPEAQESFLEKPSKVEEVIECLEMIENANKTDASKKRAKSTVTISDIHFLVSERTVNENRSSFRRNKTRKMVVNTNQFPFMRQIDPEFGDRVLAREEREIVAESFRRLGNHEYRKLNFGLAKDHYTKGIQYIKDTPVLYVNRAICHIKLREFRLGVMDCDYVLTYLDKSYIRAWLYRAAAYKRLNDEANFEDSVNQARQLNRLESLFIDDFLDKMRTLL
ncbi:tetratricopeptide repeat protein 12 [Drosophila ficusphila]|uniref:tetratricopeptide repeat protein 12 n=1 Tax=Drosophila ficusphila TaxID=30025 RepID=UPI0007E7A6C0|nr:tetratricopeptide repeat protein 12 [Drosophila ficusphila]